MYVYASAQCEERWQSTINTEFNFILTLFFKCLHVLQHAVIHVSVCLLRNRTQRPLFALLSTVCRCTSAHSEETYHHYWLAGGPNTYLPSDVIVYQIAFKPYSTPVRNYVLCVLIRNHNSAGDNVL